MARDILENILYTEMERSVGNAGGQGQNVSGNSAEGDFFDAIKNGLRNYRNVFGGFLPLFSRKSSEEQISPANEHIEMSHFENETAFDCDPGTLLRAPFKGHDFGAQQLSHPTWCDECGDFIWGVYKQCLKCNSKYLYCEL